MKSINRIMILTFAAALIVRFWLMPGINTATAQEYTRVYEDTDHDTRVAKDTTKREKKVKPPKGPGNPEEELEKNVKTKEYKTEKYSELEKYPEKEKYESVKTAKPKKVYKKQTIRPKDKNMKLEAKMFSRAVQFVEEVPLDSAEAIVTADTVREASGL